MISAFPMENTRISEIVGMSRAGTTWLVSRHAGLGMTCVDCFARTVSWRDCKLRFVLVEIVKGDG